MTETPKVIPNRRLRNARLQSNWSQEELAEKVGTTALNIGRWERGVNQPGHFFRRKLCEVFAMAAQDLGLSVSNESAETPQAPSTIAVPASTVPSPVHVWNVPYRRNLFFTGREDILTQLRAALTTDTGLVALSQPQAISGLGGIGKTQTAVEYAYRFRDFYDHIFWVRAESADLLISDFLTLASLLYLPERNEQDQHVVVNAVKCWLDTHENWLLVLDNADQLDILEEFLPSSSKGHVILTTRAYATGTLAERIDIEKMSLDDGTLFLLRRTKRLKSVTTLDTVPLTLRQQAQAIVQALDGLPLALDQAGAYIEETACSFADYLTLYQTQRTHLLHARGRDTSGHPKPVATTWSLAFKQVEQVNRAAAELLKLCAFLHPDEIPEQMLIEGATELGPVLQLVAEDQMALNEAIRELLKYSLVKRDADGKALSIHRLVQFVIHDGIQGSEEKLWIERTVSCLDKLLPSVDVVNWRLYQEYLPHALFCIDMLLDRDYASLPSARLFLKVGIYFTVREQYRDAQNILQQSLTLQKRILPPDIPMLADTMSALAGVYYEQGMYAQAEMTYKDALAAYEQSFGAEHPHVASIFNSLGLVYWQMTRYVEGEEAFKRSLKIYQQRQDGLQTALADNLNNLALIYLYQGKYAEAAPLFEQAAILWHKHEGPLHPSTLICQSNIGVTYLRLAKYAQAEGIFTELLTHYTEMERDGYPRRFDTGNALYNLGQVYYETGKYEAAEYFYQKAVESWKTLFDPDHPRITAILNSSGRLYVQQARYDEAQTLFEHVLVIRGSVTQSADLETAIALHGLASIARVRKNYAEATQLCHRALEMREQIAGSESLAVASTLNLQGQLASDQGYYEESEAYYRRALSIREAKLSAWHPSIALTLYDLAQLYTKQMRYEEAKVLYQRCLSIQQQVFDQEHPDYVMVREAYASLLQEMKQGE